MRILLLEGVSDTAVENFARAGYRNVELVTGSLSGDALLEKVADAHMLGIRSRTQLTEEVFAAAVGLADREGYETLSMRVISAVVGLR
ncbi:hypothetical protein IU462_30900, partial [Nocardia farcinica]|nr:hypothetical protein [Nocardia farcinica]